MAQQQAYQRAVDDARQALEANSAALADNQKQLDDANAALAKYAVDHPMPPGRGSLTSRTALEGRTIHIEDCLADAEYTFPEFQRIGGFRTMLGVPLLRDGAVIGVLDPGKSGMASGRIGDATDIPSAAGCVTRATKR